MTLQVGPGPGSLALALVLQLQLPGQRDWRQGWQCNVLFSGEPGNEAMERKGQLLSRQAGRTGGGELFRADGRSKREGGRGRGPDFCEQYLHTSLVGCMGSKL